MAADLRHYDSTTSPLYDIGGLGSNASDTNALVKDKAKVSSDDNMCMGTEEPTGAVARPRLRHGADTSRTRVGSPNDR
jgi:hypothetical protein